MKPDNKNSGLSVTIIALNEEHGIKDCLDGVQWADEVLVSDSGSIDKTVEICRLTGALVFSDKWLGFGAQKNLVASRAQGQWILNVDADERVSPELRDEILKAISSGAASGYYVPRKNHFAGRWIRHCGWYPDYNLRLYRKDAGAFSERAVHEAVSVNGAVGYLKNPLIHYTYEDVSDYLDRMQRYSTLSAEQMKKDGRSATVFDLLLRPCATFLKMFVLKRGFLDGSVGLTLSMLYAAYTLAKYAKLREMLKDRDASSVNRRKDSTP
ncbi:MAG: glycosyltransferase family 2 protein [Deltaproteobacteria bacterium]